MEYDRLTALGVCAAGAADGVGFGEIGQDMGCKILLGHLAIEMKRQQAPFSTLVVVYLCSSVCA